MKTKREPILREQFEFMMECISYDRKIHNKRKWKLAVLFLYISGCRVGELLEVKLSDLASLLKTKQCFLYSSKTNIERKVFLSDKYVLLLSSLLPKEDGYIMSSKNSNNLMHEKTLINYINKLVTKYLGQRYRSHSFRIGLITHMANEKISASTIKQIVGHKNVLTTLAYMKPSDKDMSKACEVL